MLFSSSEQQLIEEAIARIEETTAGEVVVATTRRSSDYALPRFAVAWCLALLTAGATWFAGFLDPHLGSVAVWVALALGFAVVPALYALVGLPTLLRRWLPASVIEAAVQRHAFAVFSARGVHRTRDASGILVLLSEHEHRVVLLADEGVHARVDPDRWKMHVEAIVEGFRQRRATEALVRELHQIGVLLAEHFPPRRNDTNELPNRVVNT